MTTNAKNAAADRASGRTDISEKITSEGADVEIVAANERQLLGVRGMLFGAICIFYTIFHLYAMNISPIEQWTYRIVHIAGALFLGYLLIAPRVFDRREHRPAFWQVRPVETAVSGIATVLVGVAFVLQLYGLMLLMTTGSPIKPPLVANGFAWPLYIGVALTLLAGWTAGKLDRNHVNWFDILLAVAAVTVALYFIGNITMMRMRLGTPLVTPGDTAAALVGTVLILELTRRVAGLALVIIASVFIFYCFIGPYMPGFLTHSGYTLDRFITYIYTDNGILGPTTAMSSTYIILFITFAAFLQASKVGDYFVNFAFAAAGRSRGGPAKVAVFASGLMGMINGTSAGNVVSTGSLTIPLMKRVGYRPQTAAAVEAAASSGGQILPPIMGAGAFIMAEITGIPYSEIVVAAIIPSLFYFVSVYLMVHFEALKLDMKGLPADALHGVRDLAKQAFLFIPIIILIYALFVGYSVIRAGTLAMAAAAVVSWLTPHRMGIREILHAFEQAARMSIQIIAVCACAGVIVGVISLTGVGSRFASILLAISSHSHLLSLFFAMLLAIILGMGMPTTAAYAIAASVIGPGLIQSGIPPLTTHFFIFYYAVMSAITPPVALAAYAGAALAGSEPMKTSVESFRIGLAAFVVPFMFFSSPALLMQGTWLEIAQVCVTGLIGIYMLSGAIIGWYFGRTGLLVRCLLFVAALTMIEGGLLTDVIGLVLGGALASFQIMRKPSNGMASA